MRTLMRILTVAVLGALCSDIARPYPAGSELAKASTLAQPYPAGQEKATVLNQHNGHDYKDDRTR